MIRAFTCWSGKLGDDFDAAMINSIQLGLDYLARTQQSDGSWIPLWFGNQAHPKQHNPVYGTVRVVEALAELDERKFPKAVRLCARGVSWLENISADTPLYGVEEIAMRVGITGNEVGHLLDLTRNGTSFSAGPIGLYFASLWYSERLYPLIFTTEALTRCLERRGTVPGQGFGQATNQWSVV
jgi:squalene-hopene/tetraprenyl-beta-curcumene cyclase